MRGLKCILKILLYFVCSFGIGLVVATGIMVLFTDTTSPELMGKLIDIDMPEILLAVSVGMLSLLVSVLVLIPLHEAGHLVCGLLTGYSFVSFRIFNLTLVRKDGKFQVKRFGIAGTGGQCLLTPPDVAPEKMPVGWYNAGGLIAQLLAAALAFPLFLGIESPFLAEALAIFLMTDLLILLLNGIPMKLNGIGNDGYNGLSLRGNMRARQALAVQLRSNVLIQNGVRPKDMPLEMFKASMDIDFSNPLEVALPLMTASRLLDEMKWEEARGKFEEIYLHRDVMAGLYVSETACELVFLSLVVGDVGRACELYDDALRIYIDAYREVMSSKERILCAVALFLEHDVEKAHGIYDSLTRRKDRYLLQGEVASDLALMRYMLNNAA